MASIVDSFIVIKGWISPTNFSKNFTSYFYFDNARLLNKQADGEKDIIVSDRKYRTLYYPNSYEFITLQSKKTERFEVEVSFKENTDFDLLYSCQKIAFSDNYNRDFNCKILEKSSEQTDENTTLYKVKFVIEKIVEDSISLNSNVENSNVNYLFGDSANKLTLNGFPYYTIFYPEIFREKVKEDKTLTFSKNGKVLTTQIYDCQVVKLKLFLTDETLEVFQKFAPRAVDFQNGVNYAVQITTNGGNTTYIAEQTLNEDDIKVNANDELVNLNEVDIFLKRDFYKTEMF